MKKTALLLIVFTAAGLWFCASCSTASKNPGDIEILRSQTESELEIANKEAGRGNYETALRILNECKRKAILCDDSSLLIRISLSLGNVLLTVGREEEAFAEWEAAVNEALKSGNSELVSICRIFSARGRLVSGRAQAQSVLDEVNREAGNIKTSTLYIAFSWQVRGLALRELRSYKDAEEAVKRSLAIHEKERYLENASYDWYLIASVRSLSGNTKDALAALENAVAIDRRIENSWGLAASWRAMGDVHRKAGNAKEAAEAYSRARAIFAAMGNEQEAAELDKRIGN
ncbi:MAG: tetratricopeptide repeat protein [Treponema sp.]|jgi:tetratricopeptide (TPR) repeat protein|nr:tetratricopeptide repeat protein [Treponema sp.]